MSRSRTIVAWVGYLLIVLALVAVLVLVLGPVAQMATSKSTKDEALALNGTRQTFLAAAFGVVTVIGAFFAGRTFYMSRRGQITDRYMKAIALLAAVTPTERTGAVYALEHVMRESGPDHMTIVDLLAAFVRQGSPPDSRDDASRLDIQAALTVLGRRPRRSEQDDLKLSDTNLSGLSLFKANLRRADLRRARMVKSHLGRADCRDARLDGANLRGARLRRTDLRGAALIDADLADADLKDANLRGANLRGAKNLTAEQLASARTNRTTVLPDAG